MKKYKAKHCIKTCDCCPSQWDIYTEDGQYLYARYRFGRFTLTMNPWRDSEELLLTKVGDEYDGEMSTSEMKELTKDIIEW